MKELLLVDGHSLLHRAFHALPRLTDSQGTPVGAVYGFIRMLARGIKEQQPDAVAVAWDTGKPTFRHEIYISYKEHRSETEEDLRGQIDIAKEFVSVMNISQYEVEGYEADDVIGTLTNSLPSNEWDIHVLSSDLDLLQLVKKNVSILVPQKGISNLKKYTPDEVVKRYDLDVGQLVDLKALMGDSSDNIPGIKGIGIKTATQLLKKLDTLDNVYENLGSVTKRAGKLLSEQKEQAYMSKKLARIHTDVPISVIPKQLKQPKPLTAAVLNFLQRYDFHSLVREVEDLTEDSQKELFSSEKRATQESVEVTVVKDNKQLELMLQTFRKDEKIFIHSMENAVSEGGLDRVLFFNHDTVFVLQKELLEKNKAAHALSTMLEKRKIVGFSLKTDMHRLGAFGIEFEPFFDIQLAIFLAREAKIDMELEKLAFNEVGIILIDQNSGEMKNKEIAKALIALYEEYEKRIEKDEQLRRILYEVEMPLLKILYEMERKGITVDVKLLEKISSELEENIEYISEDIYESIGHEVNLNSPKQLEEVLFDELRLPVVKKTKTQRSTDESVLQEIKHAHPVVEKILKYRELYKIVSTYTAKLGTLVDQQNRIHTQFNQVGSVTGRVVSENPNLQNIPRDPEVGVRKVFVSPQGKSLVALDYSQIELRILAHVSGEKHLQESFEKKQDIHAATAARIFDTFIDDVTTNQRYVGKTINFSLMYGMGPHALATALGVEYIQAKKYIDAFFKNYPSIQQWKEEVIAFAEENGYVISLWGRKMYIPEIYSSNYHVKEAGKRMATNYPNQGTQADLIKKAMVLVKKYIESKNLQEVSLLLQVHDELVLEVPTQEISLLVPAIKDIMESIVDLSVPIVVEAKEGNNWQEMKQI